MRMSWCRPRVAALFAVVVGALVFAPAAFAGKVDITCGYVLYNYDELPLGSQTTAQETVTVDGAQVASQSATFDGSSSSGSDVVRITVPADGQTHSVVAYAGANGTTWFKESASFTCTGTISAHIYECESGTPTNHEVPGGLVSATGPVTISSRPNPMAPMNTAIGTYAMSATAPAGYQFVSCGGSATVNSPSSASESVLVPPGGSGEGDFYVAYTGQSCTSSIGSNFNGTSIPGNDTIWFNSVFKPKNMTNGATLYVRDASVSFTSGGTAHTVPVPDAAITFSSSVAKASLSYSGGEWVETVPTGFSDNVFLTGAGFPVPAGGLPGGINPVTFKARIESPTGASLQWQWAAAVYTQFPSDLGAAGVKPLHSSNLDAFPGGDQAGTPEAERNFVIGGARGGGGSNFTGSYSGTASC